MPKFGLIVLLALLVFALLVLPFIALLWQVLLGQSWTMLKDTDVLVSLRLSILTSLSAMLFIVLLASPLAYILARYDFPFKKFVEALLDIPMLLPPVVAGIGLLLVFGRNGLIGGFLTPWGVRIPFSTAAVVIAQMFVAMPFYLRAMKVGFAAIATGVEEAAQIDGANTWQRFVYIVWPLTLPAFVEGFVLAWARALGEFGASIVFAGSIAAKTRTMPLAIYGVLEHDIDKALSLAALLGLLSLGMFWFVRTLSSINPYKI